MPHKCAPSCVYRNHSGYAGICNRLSIVGKCKIKEVKMGDGEIRKTVSRPNNCEFYRSKKDALREAAQGGHPSGKEKVDYSRAMQLYKQGFLDREIAEQVQCDPNTIWAWRKKKGLPANRYRRKTEKERKESFS